jgi:DNA-nicking Smr family endonuclease
MTPENDQNSLMDIIDPDIIEIPINGIIDLHTFNPRELNDLLNDYFKACIEKSIFDIRIIHGKGKGVMQKRVWALLKKNPLVESFQFAPLEAGSWGATIARLKNRS